MILIAAGVLCLLYYLVIVLYAGISANFSWFWAVAGALLIILGRCLRGELLHRLRIPLMIFGTAAAIGLAVFLFLLGKVMSAVNSDVQEELSYVVVLGAQVRKTTPSKSLKARLDKAAEIAIAYPKTQLILSGGQGPGEEITEAECMKQYLEENYSIPEERLILEERSTDTLENLRFSDEITGCGNAKTGILSNDFHVFRAAAIAGTLGYRDACAIAAPSDPVMQVHFVVREVFALLNEVRRGTVLKTYILNR